MFFDTFFYIISLIVLILMVVDWWVGPQGRRRMKDKLVDWWVHISTITYVGLATEDARRIRNGFEKIFGPKWYHARSVVFASLISLLICVPILQYVVSQYDIPFHLRLFMSAEPDQVERLKEIGIPFPSEAQLELDRALKFFGRGTILLAFAIPNAILDWLSVIITIALLRRMEKSVSYLPLASLIILDICLAFALSALTLSVIQAILMLTIAPPMLLIGYVTRYLPQDIILFILLPLFTSLLPTIIHLAITSVFLGSKLFRPIIQPLLAILIERFADSKRGVLTQLAIGGGIIAKAAQEGLKLFS